MDDNQMIWMLLLAFFRTFWVEAANEFGFLHLNVVGISVLLSFQYGKNMRKYIYSIVYIKNIHTNQ